MEKNRTPEHMAAVLRAAENAEGVTLAGGALVWNLNKDNLSPSADLVRAAIETIKTGEAGIHEDAASAWRTIDRAALRYGVTEN